MNLYTGLLGISTGVTSMGIITTLFGWSLKQGEPLLPDRMILIGAISIILGFSIIIYSIVKLSK